MLVNDAIQRRSKGQLFISISGKPGNVGETFYTALFKHYEIDAEYKACTTNNLDADMVLAHIHCNGISISMPHKMGMTPYVNDWQCNRFGPVNTIKVNGQNYVAYNCDIMALHDLLPSVVGRKRVTLLGNGAMAHNILSVCEQHNAIVTQYFRTNWESRHNSYDVLINATSIGMNTRECPVDVAERDAIIVDCVIGSTVLSTLNKHTITGADIYKRQFAHQFKIYTGIEPDVNVIQKIANETFNAI